VIQLDDTEIILDFKKRIDQFVSNCLDSYKPSCEIGPSSRKIIHDSVWGTNSYEPWEIALIDSPLIQRLRYIHQTGLSFYIYPTANHTRFDHSLGMATLVDRIIESLNRNCNRTPINKKDKISLRIAALLHDVGHGPYSHISEEAYKNKNEYKIMKKYFKEIFNVNPKPHELMSSLIVSSDTFKNWFKENIYHSNFVDESIFQDIDLEEIAGFIVGSSKEPARKFLADIINGPLDADKLEYLARDAKFSGLSINYDIERYLKTIYIHETTIDHKNFQTLSLPLSGISSLEQIVMCKMMLFSSLYHHQKVRCVEKMFYKLCQNLINGQSKKDRISIEHPVDFLKYVDSDLLSYSSISNNSYVKESKILHSNLSNRRFMKRALIISRPFIEGLEQSEDVKNCFDTLIDDIKENQDRLASSIAKEARTILENEGKDTNISAADIIIDMPDLPKMDEVLSTRVPLGFDTDAGGEIEIDDVIPISRWIEGYGNTKLRGHVFCRSDLRSCVNLASRKVFSKSPYNLILSSNATKLCKLEHKPISEEMQKKLYDDPGLR
jgi:uncharacterized protein